MLYLILFLASIYMSIFAYIISAVLQNNKNEVKEINSRLFTLSKNFNEIYNYLISLEKEKQEMLQRIQDLEDWIENESLTDDNDYNLNTHSQDENIIISRETPLTTYIADSALRHRTVSY